MRYFIFMLSMIYLLTGCGYKKPVKAGESWIKPVKSLIPKLASSEKEKNNRLFAFVGEKLDVQRIPLKAGSMDYGYKATYKILLPVYGYYFKNTIEFTVYDHYGQPEFSKYKNVLLFVSEYEGKYYHEKYQFFDVYKTKNGRWASPYHSGEYEHPYNITTIKPGVIEFAERVVYPLYFKTQDGDEITFSYPAPYYETKGDSAVAIYGNYIEDLFALKKSGTLAARGLFDLTLEQEEAALERMNEEEESKEPPDADDLKFMAFWKRFAASIKEPGLTKFKRIALDSLRVCDTLLGTSSFINNCFRKVIDEETIKRMNGSKGIVYDWTEADFQYLHSQAKKEIRKVDGIYRFREAAVNRIRRDNSPPTIHFDFIETKKGYRLYAIDHYWFQKCCQ